MREKLKKIYNHFGEENQMNKLIEEAGELTEAVREGDREHIIEEVADVLVLVEQIIEQHSIINAEILDIFMPKVDRTLERIDTRYYESEDIKCQEK